mmetsp:Transcript_10073/g.12021  ORF Transcript_10073/g.12021 Transcript_10073/m.12021 type:complete len:140 (-) Transcript_10073:34-453(-)
MSFKRAQSKAGKRKNNEYDDDYCLVLSLGDNATLTATLDGNDDRSDAIFYGRADKFVGTYEKNESGVNITFTSWNCKSGRGSKPDDIKELNKIEDVKISAEVKEGKVILKGPGIEHIMGKVCKDHTDLHSVLAKMDILE